jgi:hypothetical protein
MFGNSNDGTALFYNFSIHFVSCRWTSDNRQVVWMDSTKQAIEGDLNIELLQRYKAPGSADAVVTQETVGATLNRHNYVHKMHKLIQIEELTRAQIIAR